MQVNGNDITLEISASASSATKALDKFVSSLKSAKGVLSGKVNNGFASALDVDASKFERQLNSIDKSIERTQKKIEIFQKAVSNGLVKGDLLGEAKSNIAEHQEILSKLVEQRKELFDKAPTKIQVDSSEVDKATTKVSALSKVLNAVKRIAFYRAVRAALKGITSAFKKGIKNIYEYSRVMNTEFHTAMDGLSSDALYLKNSLGAVAAPLITAIKPAIDWITDALAGVLDLIAQVFAALSGKTSYSKAIRATTEYGEAVNKAGKALKSFTLGIDELNVIDPTSGSGAASKIPDYTKMFEEATVSSDILDFFDTIRRKIDESGLGKAIQKIVDVWKKFTESPAYQTIKDIINFVIQSGITAVLGTIADVLQIIAALLNGDITNAINGVKNVIVNLTFDPIIGLAGILDNIFGTNTQENVQKLKDKFKDWSLGDWFKDLGEKIGIGSNLKDLFGDLGDAFNDLTKIFDDNSGEIKEIFDKIVDIVKTAVLLIGALMQWVASVLGQVLGDFKLSLSGYLQSALQGIRGILEITIGLLTMDTEKIGSGLEALGKSILLAIASIAVNMLNNVLTTVESFINTAVKAVKATFPDLADYIKEVKFPRLSAQMFVDWITGTSKTPKAAEGGTGYGWNGKYDPNTHTYYYGPNKTYGENGGYGTAGYAAGDVSQYLYYREGSANVPINNSTDTSHYSVSDLSALMEEQNALLAAILDKTGDINLDGKKVTEAVNKHNKARGALIFTTA